MQDFIIQIKHLHPQNSSDEKRQGSKYATMAWVKDPETGNVIGNGMSRCNACDDIDKKYGATLARERALADALQRKINLFEKGM